DLKRILAANDVTPNVKFELEDDQGILSMFQHGMGISILPEIALYRLPENIRVLHLEQENYRTIGIAAKSFKTMARATKKLTKYLKSWTSHGSEKLPKIEE